MYRPDTLDDLHRSIILRLAAGLSAVRLLSAAAPFCDPALSIVVGDLEQALSAAQQAQRVTEEVSRLVIGPTFTPPTRRALDR